MDITASILPLPPLGPPDPIEQARHQVLVFDNVVNEAQRAWAKSARAVLRAASGYTAIPSEEGLAALKGATDAHAALVQEWAERFKDVGEPIASRILKAFEL